MWKFIQKILMVHMSWFKHKNQKLQRKTIDDQNLMKIFISTKKKFEIFVTVKKLFNPIINYS